MAIPNVTFVAPELSALLEDYKLISACIGGKRHVQKLGELVLPKPNAADVSPENSKKYDAYSMRAVFYNVTGRTLDALVGEVVSGEHDIKVSASMQPILNDINGSGVSLIQQAKKALKYNLAYSRGALFVDYPRTQGDGILTKADLANNDIRPTVTLINPAHIINWRTRRVGSREIVTQVTICELYDYEDDGFEVKRGQQMRVLYLDDEGKYCQAVYRFEDPFSWDGTIPRSKKEATLVQHEVFTVRNSSGQSLKEIPLFFFGTLNNDPSPDKPNLIDLANLNLAHYRNSADYEESCFICGQATPYATGLDQNWVDDVLKGQLRFGATGGIPLPQGASVGIIQANPNSMPAEAMATKERQMVALGARLVDPGEVRRTLGEAKMERAKELSILASAANNVEEAYNKALQVCAEFDQTYNIEVEFSFSADFYIQTLTVEERAQMMAEYQAGMLTFDEVRAKYQKAGLVSDDAETAREKIVNDAARSIEE